MKRPGGKRPGRGAGIPCPECRHSTPRPADPIDVESGIETGGADRVLYSYRICQHCGHKFTVYRVALADGPTPA